MDKENVYNFKTLVAIGQWNKYVPSPSMNTIRNIIQRREENGAEEFIVHLNGRLYVDVPKFHEWMKKHSLSEKERHKQRIKDITFKKMETERKQQQEAQLFEEFKKWKAQKEITDKQGD